MQPQKTTNILVVGIGGQGVMTASEILAEAAIAEGYDVKKTEVAGMSQRGGVVSSHVRFGARVLSPEIAPGEADILVGFEAAEAMRWSHYLVLRTAISPPQRGVAMINRLELVPPIVSLGLFAYPDDPVAAVRAQGIPVYDFDAGAIARELGDLRLVNTVMMGAIADHLPFPADNLKACIVARFQAKKPALAELNAQAFDRGRAAGSCGQQFLIPDS
jgi:indolepyruvate ferredoxin oxidoreductase beta subunit